MHKQMLVKKPPVTPTLKPVPGLNIPTTPAVAAKQTTSTFVTPQAKNPALATTTIPTPAPTPQPNGLLKRPSLSLTPALRAAVVPTPGPAKVQPVTPAAKLPDPAPVQVQIEETPSVEDDSDDIQPSGTISYQLRDVQPAQDFDYGDWPEDLSNFDLSTQGGEFTAGSTQILLELERAVTKPEVASKKVNGEDEEEAQEEREADVGIAQQEEGKDVEAEAEPEKGEEEPEAAPEEDEAQDETEGYAPQNAGGQDEQNGNNNTSKATKNVSKSSSSSKEDGRDTAENFDLAFHYANNNGRYYSISVTPSDKKEKLPFKFHYNKDITFRQLEKVNIVKTNCSLKLLPGDLMVFTGSIKTKDHTPQLSDWVSIAWRSGGDEIFCTLSYNNKDKAIRATPITKRKIRKFLPELEERNNLIVRRIQKNQHVMNVNYTFKGKDIVQNTILSIPRFPPHITRELLEVGKVMWTRGYMTESYGNATDGNDPSNSSVDEDSEGDDDEEDQKAAKGSKKKNKGNKPAKKDKQEESDDEIFKTKKRTTDPSKPSKPKKASPKSPPPKPKKIDSIPVDTESESGGSEAETDGAGDDELTPAGNLAGFVDDEEHEVEESENSSDKKKSRVKGRVHAYADDDDDEDDSEEDEDFESGDEDEDEDDDDEVIDDGDGREDEEQRETDQKKKRSKKNTTPVPDVDVFVGKAPRLDKNDISSAVSVLMNEKYIERSKLLVPDFYPSDEEKRNSAATLEMLLTAGDKGKKTVTKKSGVTSPVVPSSLPDDSQLEDDEQQIPEYQHDQQDNEGEEQQQDEESVVDDASDIPEPTSPVPTVPKLSVGATPLPLTKVSKPLAPAKPAASIPAKPKQAAPAVPSYAAPKKATIAPPVAPINVPVKKKPAAAVPKPPANPTSAPATTTSNTVAPASGGLPPRPPVSVSKKPGVTTPAITTAVPAKKPAPGPVLTRAPSALQTNDGRPRQHGPPVPSATGKRHNGAPVTTAVTAKRKRDDEEEQEGEQLIKRGRQESQTAAKEEEEEVVAEESTGDDDDDVDYKAIFGRIMEEAGVKMKKSCSIKPADVSFVKGSVNGRSMKFATESVHCRNVWPRILKKTNLASVGAKKTKFKDPYEGDMTDQERGRLDEHFASFLYYYGNDLLNTYRAVNEVASFSVNDAVMQDEDEEL